MNNIKDASPEGEWDVWSGRTVADVDDDVSLADVDRLEMQTRACVVSEPPELWVQWLLGRNGLPIDAEAADGVYDALEILLCRLLLC